MTKVTSRFLSAGQVRGLTRVGQVLAPGGGEYPSFANSGCIAQIDAVLETMPEADLNDLKMLLGIFGWLPRGLVYLTLSLLEVIAPWRIMPGVVRLIRLGLRGLVFTLYYSDEKVLSLLGYRVTVHLDS